MRAPIAVALTPAICTLPVVPAGNEIGAGVAAFIAPVLAKTSLPALTFTVPVNALSPARVSAAAPSLINPCIPPNSPTGPSINTSLLIVSPRLPESVAGPAKVACR